MQFVVDQNRQTQEAKDRVPFFRDNRPIVPWSRIGDEEICKQRGCEFITKSSKKKGGAQATVSKRE